LEAAMAPVCPPPCMLAMTWQVMVALHRAAA